MAADDLERLLARDIEQAGERLVDERFCRELYRALTNSRWSRAGADGAVALSWTRAERLVNELRERRGEPPLTLAQSGGEGEVGDEVGTLLGEQGWAAEPLDTSHADPAHVAEPEGSPPPVGTGEQQSPVEDARGWEREAHREAEDARHGRDSAPPPHHGEGAGGGHVPSNKP